MRVTDPSTEEFPSMSYIIIVVGVEDLFTPLASSDENIIAWKWIKICGIPPNACLAL